MMDGDLDLRPGTPEEEEERVPVYVHYVPGEKVQGSWIAQLDDPDFGKESVIKVPEPGPAVDFKPQST